MAAETISTERNSMAEILGRAFDMNAQMPAQTAELILQACFPSADLQRVDELLEKKSDSSLTDDESTLLDDYLQADAVLTILKSKARRSLEKGA